MTLYPQSVLDEIRDRVSIVSYIGEHIPLKKAGRNFKGLCPFHSEKTPSFMASDEKEIFHCFGCGEGGNIFNFVMKYEGISFPEAVEQLAARAGVELPKKKVSEREADQLEMAAKKKKLLFRVNQIAAEFFRNNLVSGAAGVKARNYLKYRGILDAFSTQLFLGYAEDSWEALAGHLKGKNVPLELASEIGLLKRRDATGEYYDFFRDRLIFPIISPRSEILGFGGRTLTEGKDQEVAKYLNSPDSMIYHKSHSVYGLNVAQQGIRQKDQVIIVEGYMDALGLYQINVPNVVAPLGTALTTSHLRLLGRYTKNMVLIFDGDSAGIAAASRSLGSFMEEKMMPKVVILPDGQDPDDWAKGKNGEDVEKIIDKADTLFGWFIKGKAADAAKDASKKFKVVSTLGPYFNGLSSQVETAHYRKLLADELKIDEGDLIEEFKHGGGKKRAASIKMESGSVQGRLTTERLLLSLMLSYPDFISRVKGAVDPSCFEDESFKTLFELLIEENKKGKFSVGRLIDRVGDDELANSIHSLSAGEDIDDENALEVLEDCIKYLARLKLSERLKVISAEIKDAEDSKDEERVLRLITEKNELLSQGF